MSFLHSATIPTPKICANPTVDILDGNHNYVKTLCLIPRVHNYEDGSKACWNNKMNLFKADTVSAQNTLKSYRNRRYPGSSDGKKYKFHLNGRNGKLCSSLNNFNAPDRKTYTVSNTDCRITGYTFCEFSKYGGWTWNIDFYKISLKTNSSYLASSDN